MQNTILPFALGSNVMIEIIDGMIRQLEPITGKLIKEIPVASLNTQQFAAIEKARKACQEASIAQGFRTAGYANAK